MKHFLLTISVIALVFNADAQVAIPNGGFESWTNNPMMEPQFYMTSNPFAYGNGFPAWPAQQTTDAQLNNFAVRLETQDNGAGDTLFGYFANGDPGTGEGGIPYSQRPTGLTGYWKGDVMPNDTALILVMFKLGGNTLSFNVLPIYGTQSTYTQFTLPITLPPVVNPDSVIVGAVSSNAFVSNGIPGSWIQIDNISFTGTTIQPTMLNGDFELWNTTNNLSLNNWVAAGDSVVQTTDAYAGQFAVSISTFDVGMGMSSPSYITNGYFTQNGPPMGGFPFTNPMDTVRFKYKFSAGVNDTALFLAIFTGPNVGDTAYLVDALLPVTSYTTRTLPFTLWFTPDSVAITIGSDVNNPNTSAQIGNTLIIDELEFLSEPLTTGVPVSWNIPTRFTLYPNPNEGQFTIDAPNGFTEIIVYDAAGRVIYSENNESDSVTRLDLNIAQFGSGIYFVTVKNGENARTERVIVK
jgi:hypothetical protein